MSNSDHDRYVNLIDQISNLELRFGRAFGIVHYYSIEKKDGEELLPFYQLEASTKNQAGFARESLRRYVAEGRPFHLELAQMNLIASQKRALAAIDFAIEKKGKLDNLEKWRRRIAEIDDIEAAL